MKNTMKNIVKKELTIRGNFNVFEREVHEGFDIEPFEDFEGRGVIITAWPDEISIESICKALGISRRRMERRGIFNEWSDYDCRSLLERYEENEE